MTDDINFPFQLEIIQKYISFSPQELSKRLVVCEVGPGTLLISPSQSQCREEPKIARDGGRRENKEEEFPLGEHAGPAPASILILCLNPPDTIQMQYSHTVCLIGTPSLPLHCTQTIKFHLLQSFRHCHVSSPRANKALQDILGANRYPDSTRKHTRASAIDLGGGMCLEPLPGKAPCSICSIRRTN